MIWAAAVFLIGCVIFGVGFILGYGAGMADRHFYRCRSRR